MQLNPCWAKSKIAEIVIRQLDVVNSFLVLFPKLFSFF